MYIRFLREDFKESTGILTIFVELLADNFLEEFASELGESVEDVGDTARIDGIINYVTAKHARPHMQSIQVVAGRKRLLSIPLPSELSIDSDPMKDDRTLLHIFPTPVTSIDNLPPGVLYDFNFYPDCPLDAPPAEKMLAISAVAQSKLDAPYIWGHKEDMNEHGFDCSTFTQYVYHQALGYIIPALSHIQAISVGNPIPLRHMHAGDLLIFGDGRHVGIYEQDSMMITAGGGLGKVGRLRMSPGSYWYKHLTAVKRMF